MVNLKDEKEQEHALFFFQLRNDGIALYPSEYLQLRFRIDRWAEFTSKVDVTKLIENKDFKCLYEEKDGNYLIPPDKTVEFFKQIERSLQSGTLKYSDAKVDQQNFQDLKGYIHSAQTEEKKLAA